MKVNFQVLKCLNNDSNIRLKNKRAKTIKSQNLKTKRAKHRNDKVDARQMNDHIGHAIKGGALTLITTLKL